MFDDVTYDGEMTHWDNIDGQHYEITGVDRYGKRFKIHTNSHHHAAGINLWQGTVWLCRNGRRKALKHVRN